MNKNKKGRKLHRKAGQRKHLVRNLAASLFLHDQITTSTAKAKEAQMYAEKLITKAKRNTLNDQRYLYSELPKNAATRLLTMIVPQLQHRESGYTRILHTMPAPHDNTKRSILELCDAENIQKEEAQKKKETAKNEKIKKKVEKKTEKKES